MRRPRRSRREPTIAMINIVFLLLIFFLVAGTISPPLDRDLQLVKTAELPPEAAPDALVLHADGRMSYRGEAVATAADYVASLAPEARAHPRVVPDREVPAEQLIGLGAELRAAGAGAVIIVTERALP